MLASSRVGCCGILKPYHYTYFMRNVPALIVLLLGVLLLPPQTTRAADHATLTVTIPSGAAPPAATIVAVQNVTAHSADLVVDLDATYASHTVDVAVTLTDHNGVTVQKMFTVVASGAGRVTVPLTDLLPGTPYTVVAQYADAGMLPMSPPSAASAFTTDIYAPTAIAAAPAPATPSTAADVTVALDPALIGTAVVFTVEVTNAATSATYTVQQTHTVTGATMTLPITGLNPATPYHFRVKYGRAGTATESAYSASVTTTTHPSAPAIVAVEQHPSHADTQSTVRLAVDPTVVGTTIDVELVVTNTITGETTVLCATVAVTDAVIPLSVAGLTPGTPYTYTARYAPGGTDAYSPYAPSVSSATAALAPPTLTRVDADPAHPATAAILVVDVDPDSVGRVIEMVVSVTDAATNRTTIVRLTVPVVGTVVQLPITGLTPSTMYTFVVQYAVTGTSAYSDWSNAAQYTTAQRVASDDDDTPSKKNDAGESVVLPPTPHIPPDATFPSFDDTDTVPPLPHLVVPPIDRHHDGVAAAPSASSDATWFTLYREVIARAVKDAPAATRSATAIGAAAGAVAAIASAAAPLFVGLPGMLSGNIFARLVELFGIFGRRKPEYNWGTVFDTTTHLPVPAAKVVLADAQGNELVTMYSDRHGRFGFLVEPGTYYLQASRKDFRPVYDMERDELYGNVYHGVPIIVTKEKDAVVTTNIAMESLRPDWAENARKRAARYNPVVALVKKYFLIVVYYAGFLITAIVTYIDPSVFNGIMLGLYVALFVHYVFFARRKYGMVRTVIGAPVPFAVVSLHRDATDEKEKFAVTDGLGRYYMLAGNGRYTMRAKGQPVNGAAFDKQATITVRKGIVTEDIAV